MGRLDGGSVWGQLESLEDRRGGAGEGRWILAGDEVGAFPQGR